jgi:hypothetical protein
MKVVGANNWEGLGFCGEHRVSSLDYLACVEDLLLGDFTQYRLCQVHVRNVGGERGGELRD